MNFNIEDYTFFISPYTSLVNPTFRINCKSFPSMFNVGMLITHSVELNEFNVPKKYIFIFRNRLFNNNIFTYRKILPIFNEIFKENRCIILQGSPININNENCNNYVYCIFSLKDIEHYINKKIYNDNSFHVSTMLHIDAGNVMLVNNKDTFKDFLKTIKIFKRFI